MNRITSLFIVLTLLQGCGNEESYLKISYNEKANELIQAVIDEHKFCDCLIEIPNKSILKLRREEMPLQSRGDNKRFMERLEILTETELERQDEQSENFVLDTNILKKYKIKLIPSDSIRIERYQPSHCKITFSLNKPIFSKDYKKALIAFGPAYVCSPNIVMKYQFENGKWVSKENSR